MIHHLACRSLIAIAATLLACPSARSATPPQLHPTPDVAQRYAAKDQPPERMGKVLGGKEAFDYWMEDNSRRSHLSQRKMTQIERLWSGDQETIAKANQELREWLDTAEQKIEEYRKMNPNSWIAGTPLHFMLLRASDTIEPELKPRIQSFLDATYAGASNSFDGALGGNAALGANISIVALTARLTGNREAEASAYWGIRRQLEHLNTSGDISEFNVLENHWTPAYIWEWLKIAPRDPHVRRMARLINERLWINRMLTWSPAVERLTGPGSRMAPSEWLGADHERFLFAAASSRPIWIGSTFPWDGVDFSKRGLSYPLLNASAILPDIPNYIKSIAWNKTFPNTLRSSVTLSHNPAYPKSLAGPGMDRHQPVEYTNFQTPFFAFGSVTGPWWASNCMVNMVAMWPDSRAGETVPPGRPDSFCALYPHYVFNGMAMFDKGDLFFQSKPDAPLADHFGGPSGPWLREFSDYGRFGTIQHEGSAVLMYSPRAGTHTDMLVKEKITRASAAMFLFRWNETLEGLYINDRPIESLPVQLKPGDWWFIEDGPAYAAVRPLETTKLGGDCQITIEKRTRQIALYADNFRGSGAEKISDQQWAEAQSGFVVEIGDKDRFGSFADFRKAILSGKVQTDSAKGTERRVAYSGPRAKLEVAWDAVRENYPLRQVNGKDLDWIRFLQAPEFAVHPTGQLQVHDASLETREGRTAWLLSNAKDQTWVAYQPNPEEELPLHLKTPVATVTTSRFPLGKIVVSKSDDEVLRIDVDASFPPIQNPWAETAWDHQKAGILPTSIQIQTDLPRVHAFINNTRIIAKKTKSDGKTVWELNPYSADPDKTTVDLGDYGTRHPLRMLNP